MCQVHCADLDLLGSQVCAQYVIDRSFLNAVRTLPSPHPPRPAPSPPLNVYIEVNELVQSEKVTVYRFKSATAASHQATLVIAIHFFLTLIEVSSHHALLNER